MRKQKTRTQKIHPEKKARDAKRSVENTFKFGIDSARKYYMTIGRQIDRVKKRTHQSRSDDKCKTFPICVCVLFAFNLSPQSECY